MIINKQKLIKKFGKNHKDTGNVGVQIAILTETIENLKIHLKNNKKDFKTQRNLIKQIHKRNKLLKYYSKHDANKCIELKKTLKLR